MKPQVKVGRLEMEDPTFEAGVTKTARVTLSNPTPKQFTYIVELYLGVTKVATSGAGQVTIPALGSVDATFTLVMPSVEGSYPPFLDVWHEAELLKHYQAVEDVVIAISPAIDVGPIIWT